MLSIKLVTVGTLKEAYLRDAFEEYKKRLGAFCKFSFVELKECKIPDKPSEQEIAKALDEEGKAILSQISLRSYVVALCIEGQSFSSEEFANQIEKYSMRTNEVAFVIGSAYGLSDKVKKIAHEQLSLSRMTFSHQLARILFMEVLYRSFSIINGQKYHK